MSTFFMFCAVIGGTILVCQFVLTLFGVGGDDVPDGAADLGDLEVHGPQGHDSGGGHGSTWLFSVISFRTLVAAAAFFGLGGLFAESAGMQPVVQLALACALGVGAMFAVHKLMNVFHHLSEDGTVRIQRAIGTQGTVYVPIPGNKSGSGKIHLNLQDRLMEYIAVTSAAEKLVTGTKVVVVAVIGTDTLEVTPVHEPAGTPVA